MSDGDVRDEIGSSPPSPEWVRVVQAYIREDWFTTGLAEYLEAQDDAAKTAQPAPCLGCGCSFPRHDLWVHRSFDDVAYCDACYYRRFGRQPA